MSTLLRLLLWGSLAVVVVLVLVQPRRFRRVGRRLRVVGLAYVAAVLISAALRMLAS